MCVQSRTLRNSSGKWIWIEGIKYKESCIRIVAVAVFVTVYPNFRILLDFTPALQKELESRQSLLTLLVSLACGSWVQSIFARIPLIVAVPFVDSSSPVPSPIQCDPSQATTLEHNVKAQPIFSVFLSDGEFGEQSEALSAL